MRLGVQVGGGVCLLGFQESTLSEEVVADRSPFSQISPAVVAEIGFRLRKQRNFLSDSDAEVS